MIRSLRRVEPGCEVSVLCLTPSCEQVLRRFGAPGVTLISLADFERENPDVLAIKGTRGTRDYYFTLGSCLVASILQESDPDDVVTYLDADLLFYSSPAPIFEAMANSSVGLIGHRFHWWARRLEKYGRFNVGWVSFRSDSIGSEASRWWRDRCIEWCYGCLDGDRFADQKYLEHIHARFPRVVEITHPGTNLGPWNICRHSIRRGAGRTFVVDGAFPLIFFHYSGLREVEPNLYHCSNVSYLGPFSRTVRSGIYEPYIASLEQIRRELGDIPPDASPVWEDYPPLRRRLLAPAIRLAGRLAGHYVRRDQRPRHAYRAAGQVPAE